MTEYMQTSYSKNDRIKTPVCRTALIYKLQISSLGLMWQVLLPDQMWKMLTDIFSVPGFCFTHTILFLATLTDEARWSIAVPAAMCIKILNSDPLEETKKNIPASFLQLMNATSACVCLGICAALFRHRLTGNPENWWLAVGRVNVFRSSVFNNALSPSSPKDSQSSTEWCCSVMKRCFCWLFLQKSFRSSTGLHLI